MRKPIELSHIDLPDDATVEKLRRMTPAERLARGFELNRLFREELAAFFRARHPEWTDEQVTREVGGTMLARAIAEDPPLDTHRFGGPND